MSTGVRHVDQFKTVVLLSNLTPSTSTSQWLNMGKYSHATIYIPVLNATTVTGSAITLNQAVDVNGTSSKALSFTVNWSNAATATTDALTQNTVNSNTFTTSTTNSLKLLYVIEVQDTDFDLDGGFSWLQLAAATGVACTLTAIAHLYPRYGGNYTTMLSALA